jgi:hypothetical protein
VPICCCCAGVVIATGVAGSMSVASCGGGDDKVGDSVAVGVVVEVSGTGVS